MARTTTSAATSTYKPSGYAANPSAQNSSYTGSSYAANPNAGKGTTSTYPSHSYQGATGTTTASSYAAASGNTRSTYKPSSTTSAYEEAQSEKFDQKKATSTPSSSSRTPSTPGGSSRTPSNPGGSSRTPSNPGGSSRTPSNPGGSSRTPAPNVGITPAPGTGITTPTPVQPTPSPIGGGDRITLTIPEIEAIIQKLRGSESRLREIWAELINNYIRQIENSWAGPDAEAYIEKVKAFDPKIENIAQALSLLADTYQRVITSSQDVQQQVLNVVNNY